MKNELFISALDLLKHLVKHAFVVDTRLVADPHHLSA